MVACKVAIIGAGKMAALLARRLPAGCRKVIIGTRKSRAAILADEVGGLASEQISAVRGCRVVFLAVPGGAAPQVIQDAAAHLDPGAIVANLSLELSTADLIAQFPRLRIAAVKIIGHATELEQGAPTVVVLDHVDVEAEELLSGLLEGFGTVVPGDESKVLAANQAVAEVMGEAGATLRRRLAELGLGREAIAAAITTLGPGVLRSLPDFANQGAPT